MQDLEARVHREQHALRVVLVEAALERGKRIVMTTAARREDRVRLVKMDAEKRDAGDQP